MATVQELITQWCALAYTKESQLVTSAITYVNWVYHDLENALIENIWDDFFYEYWKSDTVAGQTEYTLPTSSSTVIWFKKILSVEVKYATTDSDYVLLSNSKNSEYKQSLASLGTYLDKNAGIFDIKDSSLFIYPTPTNSVTDGIKIQAIVNLIDLTSSDAETLIFPWHTELRQRHKLIPLWIAEYIFKEKWLFDQAVSAKQSYENEKMNMVRSLKRYRNAVEGKLPDTSFYKR